MNKKLIWVAVFSALAIQGCAEDLQDRRLDDKVATETVKTQKEVRSEADQLIQSAPGLSNTQRQQLGTIKDSARAKDDELRKESNQLKAVLVHDLLTGNYESSKIDQIKTKIRSVEQQRVAVLFQAIRDANVALNRYPSRGMREAEQFYDDMMRMQMKAW